MGRHNGGFGVFGGGDLGLLSTGSDDCNSDNRSARWAQTPYRTYWAMQLVGAMTRRGSAMVPLTSSNTLVVGHAVRGPGGTLAVLVQNDDPAKAAAVRFDVPGYHAVSALQYSNADPAPHSVAVGNKLPAYSLTLIQFRRKPAWRNTERTPPSSGASARERVGGCGNCNHLPLSTVDYLALT